MGNKLIFPNFFNFINTYDIIFLFETWIEDKNIVNFNKFFLGYELRWVPATRQSQYGRARGGCLYGYKKSLKPMITPQFKTYGQLHILQMVIKNFTYNILPTYLNCIDWDADFNLMKLVLSDTYNLQNIILMGDMNVRIGEEQVLDESVMEQNYKICSTRRSKDKIVDGKGRKLLELLDDIGGLILNGRSISDPQGEFTFVGVMGSSVNDICSVPIDLTNINYDFKVLQETFSDHMPIVLSMHIENIYSRKEKKMSLLPKLNWDIQNPEIYWNKVLRNINALNVQTVTIPQITDILNDSAKIPGTTKKEPIFNQKWFDYDCFNARKKSFKYLEMFRKKNNPYVRKLYMAANKEYKLVCVQKQKAYDTKILEILGNVQNSKQWGAALRKIRNTSPICGKSIDINEFAEHFKKLMTPSSNCKTVMYAEPNIIVPFLDDEIAIDEIMSTLKKAKNGKAPGIDRIPYEFYKNAPATFIVKLQSTLNVIFKNHEAPESLKKSIIFPLFKKGDLNVTSNYRGISFMNTISKIFTGVLLQRLETWVEHFNILNEYQAGFRKGYSTIDCIYSLVSVIKIHCMVPKNKVYAFFVDFRAAFDTVDRHALFYKLYNCGVSSKLIKIMQSIYNDTQVCVWNGEELSSWFNTTMGVRQGCLLSPLLFALYLNDLDEELVGGIDINGWRIKLLMYADDVVLISDQPGSFQAMINQLEQYCNKWNLTVNTSKSKTMIFSSGGRKGRAEQWKYKGEEIETVSSFVYLGIELTPKLSFKNHLTRKFHKGKTNINLVWSKLTSRNVMSMSNMYRIFQSVNRSFLCYGAQIWGYEEYNEVEKFQRYFIKKILALPSTTPNYMINLECGIPKLIEYTLKIHFSYIIKTLTYRENRLPKFLSQECIRRNTFWSKEWRRLSEKYGLQLDLNNVQNIECTTGIILQKLSIHYQADFETEARNSVLHDEYKNLDYTVGKMYMNDSTPIHKIMTIFKARGGMLNVNSRAFQRNTVGLCSLCNMDEPETTYHFIAVCPVLREFRKQHFNVSILSRESYLEYLNGKNFDQLYNFVKYASKYRNILVHEFNM